jgi:hypothetical protein
MRQRRPGSLDSKEGDRAYYLLVRSDEKNVDMICLRMNE